MSGNYTILELGAYVHLISKGELLSGEIVEKESGLYGIKVEGFEGTFWRDRESVVLEK